MNPTRVAAIAATVLLAIGGASAGAAQAQPAPPPPPGPAPGAAPAPAPAPKTSIDKDGTYAVGADLAPGTYASAGPIPDGVCYWKRLNGDQVLDNALSKKAQVVRIEPGDTSFITNDCQPWHLTDEAPPPPANAGDLLGQLGAFIGPAILHPGPR